MKTTNSWALIELQMGRHVAKYLKSLVILISLIACFCSACYADELYVNWEANPLVADGSLTNPFTHIQDAINYALGDTTSQAIFTINVFGGTYNEHLTLNYRTSSNVTDITIQKYEEAEECIVKGVNPQLPVIYATGYYTSRLKLSGLTITWNGASIGNKGIKVGDSMNNHYFGSFEMLNCLNNNSGRAIEIDLNSITSIKVSNSTFIQHINGSLGVTTWLRYALDSEAVFENNTFQTADATRTGVKALECIKLNRLFVISNNITNMSLEVNSVGSLSSTFPPVVVSNNRFISSNVNLEYSNAMITNNIFSGRYDGLRPSVVLHNPVSAEAIAYIYSNTFYDSLTAIKLTANDTSVIRFVSAFIEGNSFINCDVNVELQRNEGTSQTNSIKLYRNNLSTSASSGVFVICKSDGTPVVLSGDDRIPITHSHFGNTLSNSTSMSFGENVSFSDPGIVLDSENNTYSLRWDEGMRSPCILKGYDDGPVSSNHNDSPDIGAVQYDAYPHEIRTYTFPAGNDRNGIKWMSFPSLDRLYGDEDMAFTLFGQIMDIIILRSIAWKVENDDPIDIHFDEHAGWVGQNHPIQPQVGYKFQMNPNLAALISITTPAIKPDPALPITLKARTNSRTDIPDNENWLGYFGEATVRPYDAFAEVIDNLWYIQHQDWTLVRLSVVPGSPWIGVAYPGFREPTLKYGDMVIVKCFNDAQFTWNTEAPAGESFIKEQPTKFTFTEKLDYIPVYVEFTGTEIPKEAAVYVEGICKGAAVVGGNSVEIPAYILDDIGYNAELELRVYYDNKAAYNSIPQYQVWNMEDGLYENSSLILSERKPYYMLKMDGGSVNDTPAPKLYLGSYPNPFNPDTTLRFTLPANADISLDIYNVKGQKVRSLKSGNYSAGTHTCPWDAKDDSGSRVASGLYFAMLSYQGNQLSRKLLLMK